MHSKEARSSRASCNIHNACTELFPSCVGSAIEITRVIHGRHVDGGMASNASCWKRKLTHVQDCGPAMIRTVPVEASTAWTAATIWGAKSAGLTMNFDVVASIIRNLGVEQHCCKLVSVTPAERFTTYVHHASASRWTLWTRWLGQPLLLNEH